MKPDDAAQGDALDEHRRDEHGRDQHSRDEHNKANAAGTLPPDLQPRQWYLDQLASDVDLIAAAIGAPDALTRSVIACPGWDVRQLVGHLGFIHRWATYAVQNAEPAPQEVSAAFQLGADDDPAAWLQAGATQLIEALANVDLDAPTWIPWTGPAVGAFWPRRQMQETSIHRWDVQAAVGTPDRIVAEVAADGIDEWLALAVPRRHGRDNVAYPAGSFHVHCTDVEGEWLAWAGADGDYHLERAHQKGDAALRGPADAINLTLWGRTPTNADELSTAGDESVVAAWTSFGGV